MTNLKTVQFNKKPSDLMTLLQAYRSRKSRFTSENDIPEIHVIRSDLKIDTEHLKLFNSICGIDTTLNLHIMYPFTLAYPYLMRILCRKEMPFSQFKILNIRNRITMFRQIKPDELFTIDCYNSAVRTVTNGLEFEFKAEIYSGIEKVWETTATYFNRGKFGTADPLYKTPRLDPAENPQIINQWFLDAENRFKFGRISGDTNGIHYSPLYAKMFGFKRDFSQPIRVTARCVSELPDHKADKPGILEFYMKGPVYYKSKLTLKNRKTDSSDRFDLYCEGNEKPCISAKLVAIN